jgi:hypothetical protein
MTIVNGLKSEALEAGVNLLPFLGKFAGIAQPYNFTPCEALA